MPAEWSVHQRTFISWPVQASMCYPEDYDQVCRAYYTELIKAIAEFEPVTVIVNPDEEDLLRGIFSKEATAYELDFLPIPHNDAWIRDNGPTFLVNRNGEIAGVNWRFNAWGEKYAPWDLDNETAPKILDYYGIKRFDAPLVLEGGSIHSDGEGTILTTEECLLNPNRNPSLSREEIEDYLKLYLNADRVIWLKRGLAGDETDGHVDNIACFAAPGRILIQISEDPEDKNYHIARENINILQSSTDAKGRSFEIIPILQPPPRWYGDSRLTLSYINFYFVNNGIILPVFGGDAAETDIRAEQVLNRIFPERRVRKVDGMAIIKEGGNVHCTTQQMPLPVSKEKGPR
ncbi:MAG TPA: agmatine deiminase family protein [Clostridiales bacterium]|nr:agmatine deiminase family protein [Clostridiales bacterium]